MAVPKRKVSKARKNTRFSIYMAKTICYNKKQNPKNPTEGRYTYDPRFLTDTKQPHPQPRDPPAHGGLRLRR